MEKKYRAADFGRLILHWFLTLLGMSTAYGLQYSFMESTYRDGAGFLPIDVYSVNIPLFVIGALVIVVGYIFAWVFWLKKDLIRCIQCHWCWVIMYGLMAAWNLFLTMVAGIAAQLLHLPGLFSTVDSPADMFPFVVVAYMILLSVSESLITGMKMNKKEQP